MLDKDQQIMTVREVAEYLQISERTVTDWAQKGEIPCGKLGNSWRFKRSEVESWLERKLSGEKSTRDLSSVTLDKLLAPGRIVFLDSPTKDEVLYALIERLASTPQITSRNGFARAIFRREEMLSTGLGNGVAVPHVRLPSITGIVMGVAVARHEVQGYDALDGKPVRLVFMIGAGADQQAEYLRLLADLSRCMRDSDLRDELLAAPSPQAFYSIFTQAV